MRRRRREREGQEKKKSENRRPILKKLVVPPILHETVALDKKPDVPDKNPLYACNSYKYCFANLLQLITQKQKNDTG